VFGKVAFGLACTLSDRSILEKLIFNPENWNNRRDKNIGQRKITVKLKRCANFNFGIRFNEFEIKNAL
jgi:hypothetical protein